MFLQDLALVLAVQDGQAAFTLNRNLTDIYVGSTLAVPQAWSLSVELVFYLIAPIILNLSCARLVSIFAFFLAIKIGAVGLIDSDLPYRMFPFVLVHFLAGALAYQFRHKLKYPPWISYVLMFSIVLIIPSFFEGALLSFVCLALTAIAVPVAFYATKNFRYDSYVGELSYPFYIFHYLCLLVFTLLFKMLKVENDTALLLTTLGVTVGLSLFVLAVETRYLEPWRQRLGRPLNSSDAVR
jgi:peptidoglycan/LPS O-acetylase OafA/YrhL